MDEKIKTDYADLLNDLNAMGDAILYRARRDTIKRAESLILDLEGKVKYLNSANENLRAKLAEAERERDETFDNGPMGEEVNDILRAKLAELEKDCDAKDHVIQIQRTKLAEAERDAARYRYLRANCVQGRMESRGPNPDFALNCDEPESEWDAAIDAAMPSTSHDKEGK